MKNYKEIIKQNWDRIKKEIEMAMDRVGRTDFPSVLPVVKTFEDEAIFAISREGFEVVGENRVERVEEKLKVYQAAGLGVDIIGHLQSKKVKKLIRLLKDGLKLRFVHSLDRESLLNELIKRANSYRKEVKEFKWQVFLELKTSFEETKHGADEESLLALVESLKGRDEVEIVGIMTMAPFVEDEDVIRASFKKAADFRKRLEDKFGRKMLLSAGMSSDFKIAVEEGSDLLRIGTAFIAGL